MAPAGERFPMKHLRALSQNGKSSTQTTTTTRNATPSPGPSPAKEDLVGEWLCADGPYRKYIQALSKTNPGLTTADPNNKDIALKYGNAKVVLLESPAEGPPKFELKQDFDTCAQLQEHFRGSPRGPEHDHGSRRIYIMEGLAPDYVATIGGHFFMEPNFWLRQERTCVWSNDFTPVSDALPQPSLLDPDKSFHVQYCELRQFNKALESRPFFCGRTRRHVGMTAPRGKDDTTTAILRRKVSWWCDQIEGHKSWDVVILCDPQLKELTPNPKKHILKREPQVDHNTQTTQDIKADDKLINTPFQGGYIDFMPPPRPINGQAPPLSDHPHESMLGDLIYYYTKDCARLDKDNDWLSPTTSAFFLKKIVAAHYLQLADYIKAMLPSLELKLTTAWVEEREQWKGLQIISRRCGNYRDDIEDTLLSLGYPLEIPRERGKEGERRVYGWRDCEIDYQYVYFRLKILKERADNLMTSMTGLASIAGNRQNLEEAKRVKRLNLLALLFIPLAYTSSLFSMQDEYAPNKPQFWVYWVCAIGVVVFTSVVTFILDRALNDAAEWTIPFKKLLVGGEKGTDTTLNRVTTGFYGPSKRTRTG